MAAVYDKTAEIGMRGRRCRYAGDRERGLEIELAPGDALRVGPEEIHRIFAELGAHNRLLAGETGERKMRRELAAWLGEYLSFWLKHVAPPADLVSRRWVEWLAAHARKLWGRPLTDAQALGVQAVFAAEGLLPIENGRVGDFPGADLETSLRALLGVPLIYEEAHKFVAVELREVHGTPREPRTLRLLLGNLSLPGFAAGFPPEWEVSVPLEGAPWSDGKVACPAGIWVLRTNPERVRRIIAVAATRSRDALYREVRWIDPRVRYLY